MARCTAAAWIVPLLLAAAPAAAQRQKMAVLDLKAQTALDEGMVKMLNELLLTEVQDTGRFEVLGSSDIASMMTLEEQRIQLTGCMDDSCLVEIGGALGVNLLLASSVGAVGEHFLVSLKLLDVAHARVLNRVTETVERDDSKLISAIRTAVDGVCGVAGQPLLPATGVSAEAGTGSQVGFLDVAPWIALGLTVAAGAAGGALGGMALKDEAAMDDEVLGTSDWRDLKQTTENEALAADVLLGVAGAAAVGTVVLFVLWAMDSDDPPAATAGIAPARGGGVFSFGLRFR